ncbi:cytochrome c oxidase subunit 4 [Georgenia sp. Z1344]|uniref:cytochrome c oxidase subunit 4 n=1 Tax=Georgenia sp. Z1344 TaxID=3416706 RepID=UPI003CF3CA2F
MTAQQPDGSSTDPIGIEEQQREIRPMRVEIVMFTALTVFFTLCGVAYAIVADFESVGTVGFLLLGGMNGFVAVYLWLTARTTDAATRWEDDPYGEIADRAGDIGDFAPRSWWPLVLGVAATFGFVGIAAGWWLTGIGFVIAIVGVAGQMYEANRGIHAH